MKVPKKTPKLNYQHTVRLEKIKVQEAKSRKINLSQLFREALNAALKQESRI